MVFISCQSLNSLPFWHWWVPVPWWQLPFYGVQNLILCPLLQCHLFTLLGWAGLSSFLPTPSLHLPPAVQDRSGPARPSTPGGSSTLGSPIANRGRPPSETGDSAHSQPSAWSQPPQNAGPMESLPSLATRGFLTSHSLPRAPFNNKAPAKALSLRAKGLEGPTARAGWTDLSCSGTGTVCFYDCK